MMKYLLIAIFGLSIVACKVSYSFNGADICDQCKTVSVQFFENNATNVNPELSQKLTEAIKDKFNNETSVSLVSNNGDLDFSGYISDYRVQSVSLQGNETAAMNRLNISIHAIYQNIHEEDKNFEADFSRYADFESSKNLSQVESELIDQIIEQLVQDIFNKSVVNW